MACVIFYTHQTSGACAGVCACERMHQMEKIAQRSILFLLLFLIYINKLSNHTVSTVKQSAANDICCFPLLKMLKF